MTPEAIRRHKTALSLMDRGNVRGAERQFRKAIEAAPDWSHPWYNLGLLYKQQHDWRQSFACNQEATKLDPNDKAGWWNLGIAATALGKWSEARLAWLAYGVPVPPGQGPIVMNNLGLTPIRLNPDASPEVVWCRRIDPARAIIENVPFPISNHRYGDLLLHDGEPKGYRMHGSQEVPVFNELERLEISEYATFEVVLEASHDFDREALVDLAQERKLGIDDWSAVRMLCKLCSEGRPHDDHHEQPPNDGPLVRYGIAAKDEADVDELLADWRQGRFGCLVLELECVLPNADKPQL